MRLFRLDNSERPGSPTVTADLRAALTTLGTGTRSLGGMALIGSPSPGLSNSTDEEPIDAVLVLPRGVIVVKSVELPNPSVRLHAPLTDTWTADGWPLTRQDGAINPVADAEDSVTRVARRLQDAGTRPMPVGLIIAVGPFTESVSQPHADRAAGIRVLHPTVTSVLTAARELANAERPYTVDQARHLMAALAPELDIPDTAELTAEGFDVVPTASTTRPPTVTPPPGPPPRRRRVLPIAGLVTLTVLATALGWPSGDPPPSSSVGAVPGDRIEDGDTEFLPRGSARDLDCAANAYGEVRVWLAQHPCGELTRALYEARVGERRVAVAVTVVRLADAAQAKEFRALSDINGSGSVHDLVWAGRGWDGGPRNFDGAAYASSPDGARVRLALAVWLDEPTPDEVPRTVLERALRVPITG